MHRALASLFITFVLAISRASADEPAPHVMESRISAMTLGVQDLDRAFQFYRNGLGFATSMNPDGGLVLFATSGTRLLIYPYDKLAKESGFASVPEKPIFSGVTLIHCVRRRELVDQVLYQAEIAGGKIVKPATATSWGGFSGYFADPDGYLWEVAYSEKWTFAADGSVNVE